MLTRFRRIRSSSRQGNIIALSAAALAMILGFLAFTVDVGFIELTRTQLQAAADASALSAAMELSGTESPSIVRANARAAALDIAARFKNGEKSTLVLNPSTDIQFGRLSYNYDLQQNLIQWGDQYTPYNVVRVFARRTAGTTNDSLPLFFAPVIGHKTAEIAVDAIATFQPRDIMVVLDYSGSMNDDSSLGAIDRLGRAYVESNLYTMWQELGSPVYGNLEFTPKYATLKGVPAVPLTGIPHITATYRRSALDITSTSTITQIRLRFSNGNTQTFTYSSGTARTVSGTGSNSGRDIVTCWVKSGSNGSLSSGNNGEQFDFTDTNIKIALGLNILNYPKLLGSWQEYIDTVQASSGDIKDAGYRDMYGYLTWIEYLQTKREAAHETQDLWKTSEQPVRAMKDAVDLFIDHLRLIEAEDKVGLSVYSHTNSTGAILEHGLSVNIEQVSTTARQRQAGHYLGGTNISAGMKVARQELIANARPRAFRMMVLLTDGQANLPSNSTVAKAKVIEEAELATAAGIKIMTISLGAGADTSLMQQVADMTGGVHFNVPGGSSISQVQAQLQNVFREIATSRPLKLISDQ